MKQYYIYFFYVLQEIMSSNEDEIEREVRGAARGMRLNRIVEVAGHTIPITWTPAQGKPVGGIASLFNAEIGILVRTFIPLKYAKKKEIPNELYISMIERLLVSELFLLLFIIEFINEDM